MKQSITLNLLVTDNKNEDDSLVDGGVDVELMKRIEPEDPVWNEARRNACEAFVETLKKAGHKPKDVTHFS